MAFVPAFDIKQGRPQPGMAQAGDHSAGDRNLGPPPLGQRIAVEQVDFCSNRDMIDCQSGRIPEDTDPLGEQARAAPCSGLEAVYERRCSERAGINQGNSLAISGPGAGDIAKICGVIVKTQAVFEKTVEQATLYGGQKMPFGRRNLQRKPGLLSLQTHRICQAQNDQAPYRLDGKGEEPDNLKEVIC